ncbi:hypothetical protein [Rubripirellula obstinata]|uniref:hypothetical protein n=1 Tax=Rubripirellula obstinata TaxID=406547 RepID=UPI00122C3A9A|nr:hypothetical protein [Rubripirellula obstinata]
MTLLTVFSILTVGLILTRRVTKSSRANKAFFAVPTWCRAWQRRAGCGQNRAGKRLPAVVFPVFYGVKPCFGGQGGQVSTTLLGFSTSLPSLHFSFFIFHTSYRKLLTLPARRAFDPGFYGIFDGGQVKSCPILLPSARQAARLTRFS